QPLTAVEMNISAAIHFLRRRAPAIDEAIEALDDALRQQHRMRDALQVLQDLAVRREPRWDAVDIAGIIREVIALVESDALARRVPLVVDAHDARTVTGDATLIRQALLNVVLDALEATSRSTTPTAAVQIAIRPDGEAAQVTITHPAPEEDDASGTSSWSL